MVAMRSSGNRSSALSPGLIIRLAAMTARAGIRLPISLLMFEFSFTDFPQHIGHAGAANLSIRDVTHRKAIQIRLSGVVPNETPVNAPQPSRQPHSERPIPT